MLLHWRPKSREILMFVCLQKDAKQGCDATKLDCTHCAGRLYSLCWSSRDLATWLQTNTKISGDLGPHYNSIV